MGVYERIFLRTFFAISFNLSFYFKRAPVYGIFGVILLQPFRVSILKFVIFRVILVIEEDRRMHMAIDLVA